LLFDLSRSAAKILRCSIFNSLTSISVFPNVLWVSSLYHLLRCFGLMGCSFQTFDSYCQFSLRPRTSLGHSGLRTSEMHWLLQLPFCDIIRPCIGRFPREQSQDYKPNPTSYCIKLWNDNVCDTENECNTYCHSAGMGLGHLKSTAAMGFPTTIF
jgi:hypothetical protein